MVVKFTAVKNERGNEKRMKKFYDREKETGVLKEMQEQAYSDCSRFVVLTGRRRVGKTSLVNNLIQESAHIAPGLYFFVGRKTETVLVRNFAEEVQRQLGEYIPESITSFRELFRMLLGIASRRKFTLFIDEFQEFDNINSGIFSDIQELWDRYKKDTNMCLVASGSIYRMMEKIFKDEEQPLFGRDDCTIRLQPFRTDVIREILHDYKPDYTKEDLLALWTLTGGVARYVELLMNNGCTSVRKMIHFVCANADSYFIDEGKKILVQEFGKQYGTYFGILGQIAYGEVTQSEIEKSLGMDSLGGQLKILDEKYGIIRKKRPIGAKENSQTVRYEITDNFFRFWFRYIYKYSDLIEIQNMTELEKRMQSDYKTFSGIALERWFRQRMMESCRYKQIGGWWLKREKSKVTPNEKGNNDEFEIDIVAVTTDDRVEAYEVKRNMDKYRHNHLEEKVAMMQRNIFKGRQITIGGLSMENMED